ncbi:MAG: hypothetical protein AAF226_01035 [Verrucomicrobiota bacterium]
MTKPPLQWPTSVALPEEESCKINYRVEERDQWYHVYTTENFHIAVHGNFPVVTWQMQDIARVAEATRLLFQQSPIGVYSQPLEGYYRIEIYDNRAKYHLATGSRNSAGSYNRYTQSLSIPVDMKKVVPTPPELREMGPKMMTISYDMATLVHELTHMMMHEMLDFMPQWLVEGSAEFVEEMPRRDAQFMPDRIMLGLQFISKHYRRDNTYPEPVPLGDILLLTRKEWHDTIGGMPDKQKCLYYCSYLLTSYFMLEKPETFQKMLNVSRRKAAERKQYYTDAEQYKEELDAFIQLPGVMMDKETNTLRYNPELTPPTAPTKPGYELDEFHAVMLEGRSAAEVGAAAEAWARNLGLYVRNSY